MYSENDGRGQETAPLRKERGKEPGNRIGGCPYDRGQAEIDPSDRPGIDEMVTTDGAMKKLSFRSTVTIFFLLAIGPFQRAGAKVRGW